MRRRRSRFWTCRRRRSRRWRSIVRSSTTTTSRIATTRATPTMPTTACARRCSTFSGRSRLRSSRSAAARAIGWRRRSSAASAEVVLAGVDPSAPMLERARVAAPSARAGPGARRRSPVARRDVRPPLLRQRPSSFRRPRPLLRRGAPRAQARRRTADHRQGSPHRSRRLVGLRILRRNARDRSRALRAGADAARRDGAGRLRVGGVVGGRSHRGRCGRRARR